MSTDSQDAKLSPCGCCESDSSQPAQHNRPSQPALTYRIGTHATILRRMLTRLHTPVVSNGPSLADLTTRASDDPVIALLDAWAVTADVLTFYQERIANEGYLRTAVERRSVLELARAIGYELNPGVAASGYLAFTVEDATGALKTVSVPKGTQVQSVPAPGKLPQTFETVEKLEARVEWSALTPQQTAAQAIGRGVTELYLDGVSTNLQQGDTILIVGEEREEWPGSERWDLRIVEKVTPYSAEDYTVVSWEDALGHEKPTVEPANNPKVYALRQRAALFGHNAPDWRTMSKDIKAAYDPQNKHPKQWPDFEIQTTDERIVDLDAAYPKILEDSWIVLSKPHYQELYRVEEVTTGSRTDFTLTSKVARLKLDAQEHLSWFGLRDTVVLAQSESLDLAEQPITLPVYGKEIALDQVVEGLKKGQVVIVSGQPMSKVKVAGRTQVVRTAATEETRVQPGLYLVSADSASSVLLSAGDTLEIVKPPTLEKDGRIRFYLKDENGFSGSVAVTASELIGQAADEDEETISEVATIEQASDDEERTTITLQGALKYTYDRTTVSIYANVVLATHGETVKETLGSGDGAESHQRFKLKKEPLTYVSAATASGAESTLEMRVNDVLWQEASSLYTQGARSESYIVRIADDGTPAVIFGDGLKGARLPSGVENVKAVYRSGSGPDGEVAAGSLTLLKTRPQGIREVVNPVAASGAAAPETLDEARANAPLTVLTLERIVSLRDYEDFARAFAGIGKAQAIALWDGETHLVHVTVASSSGKPIDTTSTLYANLCAAIKAARDPLQPFRVSDYESVLFKLAAKVLVDARYVAADVFTKIKSALSTAFSFAQRSLGQPVTAADVMRVMLKTPGVVAVDLDQLYLSTDSSGPSQTVAAPVLIASRADWDQTKKAIRPAQLLLLDPAGVTLLAMEN
jgi:hypothetical protein